MSYVIIWEIMLFVVIFTYLFFFGYFTPGECRNKQSIFITRFIYTWRMLNRSNLIIPGECKTQQDLHIPRKCKTIPSLFIPGKYRIQQGLSIPGECGI